MATTYLSAAAAAAAAANYHHYSSEQDSASAAAAVAMNLVNSSPHSAAAAAAAAAGGYCSPRDMHEMKYHPPHTSCNTPPVSSPLHNGHPLVPHNPWVTGLPTHDPWAMHPHAGLYASAADLKPQDIKPHSPGDFNSVSRTHHAMAASWNAPPVSSPYLTMPQAASTPGGVPPVAPNSPSPQLHHPYGMNGMMPPHHFVDRYSRESHNSSPRSGTDEDPMQPSSGTHTGMVFVTRLTSFYNLLI
jgi:hypothetical protein